MATACSSADQLGRSAVWAIAYLLIRFALYPTAPVPGILFADPIAVLLPLAVHRNGMRALQVLLPAFLIADLFTNLHPVHACLRTGFVAAFFLRRPPGSLNDQIWNLSAMLVCWHAMLICWAGDWTFTYLAGISGCAALIFIWLAGSARLVSLLPPRNLIQVLFWTSLPLIALLFPNETFWPAHRIGEGSTPGAKFTATLLAIALLLLAKKTAKDSAAQPQESTGSTNSKWMKLAD